MYNLTLFMYDEAGIRIRFRCIPVPSNKLIHMSSQLHILGFRKATPNLDRIDCFIYDAIKKGKPVDSCSYDKEGNPYYLHIKPATETIENE